MILQFPTILNLKSKGFLYFIVNIVTIIFFSIIYNILNISEGLPNPWHYWLYFSTITQTTVGYSGIRTIYDEDKSETEVSILSIDSPLFKMVILAQLISIIVIHSIFLSI